MAPFFFGYSRSGFECEIEKIKKASSSIEAGPIIARMLSLYCDAFLQKHFKYTDQSEKQQTVPQVNKI
ncbi:hypothetical protein ACFSYG_10390 [Leeuwenhoekiella polynyae]|uniref:Uncharacterized protein n=1 Tax=Leeuwenhoekiella polynyae TaxID=1550906 RepID=A0A4Q0NV99_9FLAO|nr:hypothetical protein [Leeuwenhoekiella polynyae]RXG14699.1 hypothetical protein DSM02_3469 [Leeuwenhoekiella polynyae]